MKLSIIIVNYNVKFYIEQCLDSIVASKINFRYEIYIVDNNSTDNSLEYLKTRFTDPDIHFIANDDNRGFAKANNQAIKRARGEYILLLNPDTVLGENVLYEVCHFLDNQPDAGCVGVKMIDGSGSFLAESKRDLPTPWVSFCKVSGLSSLFPKSKIFGRYSLGYLDENTIHKVPVLAGAFMMVRSTILEQTGLLDEAFFMYGEDIDLSYRILQTGAYNYYLPHTIIHYKGQSTDNRNKKYQIAFYDAMRIFLKKHFGYRSKLYITIIRTGIDIQALFSTFHSRDKRFAHIRKQNLSTVILNTEEMSYDQIIKKMEQNKYKNTEFLIYNYRTGMIIGTQYAIQVNKDASEK